MDIKIPPNKLAKLSLKKFNENSLFLKQQELQTVSAIRFAIKGSLILFPPEQTDEKLFLMILEQAENVISNRQSERKSNYDERRLMIELVNSQRPSYALFSGLPVAFAGVLSYFKNPSLKQDWFEYLIHALVFLFVGLILGFIIYDIYQQVQLKKMFVENNPTKLDKIFTEINNQIIQMQKEEIPKSKDHMEEKLVKQNNKDLHESSEQVHVRKQNKKKGRTLKVINENNN